MERIGQTPLALTAPKPIALTPPSPVQMEQTRAAEAAEKFEAVLALQMIRSMQTSLQSQSLFGDGPAGDVYGGLVEWELAQILARSADLGVKKQILEQMPKREERQP